MKSNGYSLPVNRMRSLDSRYRALGRKLADELGRPAPDFIAIRQMKKQRLLIKDRIAVMMRPIPAA